MKNENFGSFAAYRQIEMGLSGDLNTLKEYSLKLGLTENAAAIEETQNKVLSNKFDVAIVGEFKRGKSTLINALIGQGVLPMDVLPTTATINRVTYDPQKYAHIIFKDGRKEDVHIDRLEEYVTKLSEESEEMAKTVEAAIIHYPVPYCKNNVDIIDTPGLNDDESMTTVTMSVLPTVDAAIMVIMAQSPFSDSERRLLESNLLTNDLGRILFAVTGIDRLDEDEVEKVLTNITNRINTHVLIKAKKMYGLDSEEYREYKRKMGTVRVFGLSAKQALKAKITHNNELLETSCFPAFEQELERFLTEDRGAVMLSAPVARILGGAIEIAKAMELRQHALNMDDSTFDEKYQRATAVIQNIRKERAKEFSEINQNAENTFRDLKPLITSYWRNLENAAVQAIDAANISADDIKNDAVAQTAERLISKASDAMREASQLATEQIQEKINMALGKEAERMTKFESNFMQETAQLQASFVDTSGKSSNTDLAITAVASSLLGYGLGGVYLGYKEGGWKGAVLGGATSMVGTVGSAVGFGVLTAALAIPVTWPVLLVGGIGAALAGTFTGKWALGKVFTGKKIAEFKEKIVVAVKDELIKMKIQSSLSSDVSKQVDLAFNALKQKIENESEAILIDTEQQLRKISADRAHAHALNEQEEKVFEEMKDKLEDISKRAQELKIQLDRIFMEDAV